jgi:hypothetical protein
VAQKGDLGLPHPQLAGQQQQVAPLQGRQG